MVIRIKSRTRKSHKMIIGTTRRKTNRLKKGVSRMTMAIQIKDSDIELEENTKFDCMSNIRNIVQKTIKEKGLTEKQIRMSFGVKRYEK